MYKTYRKWLDALAFLILLAAVAGAFDVIVARRASAQVADSLKNMPQSIWLVLGDERADAPMTH